MDSKEIWNLWSSCTATDYYSYRQFRLEIEESIIARNRLIVLELWENNKVDKPTYQKYLGVLNNL